MLMIRHAIYAMPPPVLDASCCRRCCFLRLRRFYVDAVAIIAADAMPAFAPLMLIALMRYAMPRACRHAAERALTIFAAASLITHMLMLC